MDRNIDISSGGTHDQTSVEAVRIVLFGLNELLLWHVDCMEWATGPTDETVAKAFTKRGSGRRGFGIAWAC